MYSADKYKIFPSDAGTSSVKTVIFPGNDRLWYERRLLDRLVYKSKNQHRSGFHYRRLVLLKRLMGRLERLKTWLEGNYCESGEKLIDFIGYSNSLRELIDYTVKACSDCFYYYRQLLDQVLFVPLSMTVVGTISTISEELKKWKLQAVQIYSRSLEKLKTWKGDDAEEVIRQLGLTDPKVLIEESKTDRDDKTLLQKPVEGQERTSEKTVSKQEPAFKKPRTSPDSTKKTPNFTIPGKKSFIPVSKKPAKKPGVGNEIDDIFGSM